MNQDLKGVVAVVTGSSRGVGRGIAVALGAHGATVYVTGRTAKSGDSPYPGTVFEAAEAVTAAGGKGIPVICDFADDAQIKKLFEQVEREQGKLHILVNNAAVVPPELYAPGAFWEKSLELVDLLDVGLRSSYVASYYAAPLLVRGGRGVVVNTSTYGASSYIHGPMYGAQKAGHDKLACDMAVDFREHNVAACRTGSVRCSPNACNRRWPICRRAKATAAYSRFPKAPSLAATFSLRCTTIPS